MLLLNHLLRKLFVAEINLLLINAIVTFCVCSLAIIFRERTLFFINLSVFTSSCCLLFHNKINNKHKILINQSGKSVIVFFLISLALYLLKSFL